MRLIPTTNVYEVTAKRALLNYAIIQDIPFDVGQVIEDAILHNKEAKMNLGHPFHIYDLCKLAGVPLEDKEACIHPIKAIMAKSDKPGVPRPKSVYDSGNEPSDEDEFESISAGFVSRQTPRVTLDSPPSIPHHHRPPPIPYRSHPRRRIRPILPIS